MFFPSNVSGESLITPSLPGWNPRARSGRTIGVLRGEGVGTEVMDATLTVLDAVSRMAGERFPLRFGGEIGLTAQRNTGRALTPEVAAFCESVFADHGAILAGPGGGRFVYDLRARFHLFCKVTPLRPLRALADAGVFKPHVLEGIDIVLVRENCSGLYFGEWSTEQQPGGQSVASHTFRYRSDQVERILRVAADLARRRRGRLCMVVKTDGVPSVSALWNEALQSVTRGSNLQTQGLEVDNAAFQLVHAPKQFDVIVSPNMFGDVLADCGSALLGSRGLSYSGNFGADGVAVYQTGHGSAHGIGGKDRANPIGQILALAMLLRESFGLAGPAAAIETAVERALAEGWRTADIAGPDCKVIGTREMGLRIAAELEKDAPSSRK